MEMNPSIKQKLLHEILPVVEKHKTNLIEGVDYESVMEFEFLQKCFYETMRIEPPVPLSTAANMSKQVTINGVVFYPDTPFYINIRSLHHDAR